MFNNTTTQQHNIMVYDTNSLKPCHDLTSDGWMSYFAMLERKADEILFKRKHPIKYWWQRLRNLWEFGDSEWLGPEYSEEDEYQDGFSYSGHQG